MPVDEKRNFWCSGCTNFSPAVPSPPDCIALIHATFTNRVMRYAFASGVFLFASLLFSGSANAAETATEHWKIIATETDQYHVNFALEYIVSDATTTTSSPSPSIIVEAPVSASVAAPAPIHATAGSVLINEFVSDPVTGSQEWIELWNTTSSAIDVAGWWVEEGSGRKTMLEGTIAPLGYSIITSPSGGLNNAGDLILLKDSYGDMIDRIAYGAWDDGSLDDNPPAVADPDSLGRNPTAPSYFALLSPTPGRANVLLPSVNDVPLPASSTSTDASVSLPSENTVSASATSASSTLSYDISADPDSASPTSASSVEASAEPVASDESPAADSVSNVPLSRIRDVQIGTKVATEGIVSVLPGILGKQFFYLAETGAGVQVYLYSAEFPTLVRGMRLRVTGERTEASGEAPVKLASASAIEILGTSLVPEAADVTAILVNERSEGQLVRLTGTISARTSSGFTLHDETGEVVVAVKSTTNIAQVPALDENVTVTGIVGQTTSGYRVMPRDQNDLVVRTAAEATPSEEPSVTEEAAAAAGLLLQESSPPGNAAGWTMTAGVVGALSTSFVAYMRKRRTLTTS